MVLTDQDPAFLSAAWKNVPKLEGTDSTVTAAYSQQSNGRAERMVQIIKSAITRLSMDQEAVWDELLPIVVNAVYAKRRRDGFSPYEMLSTVSSAQVCLQR